MIKTADRVMEGIMWKFWGRWLSVFMGAALLLTAPAASGQEEAEAGTEAAAPAEVAAEDAPKSLDDIISGIMKTMAKVI